MKRAMLCQCPRCGEKQLERFSSYSYCSGCNFSEDRQEGEGKSIPAWVFEFLKSVKPKALVASLLDTEPTPA